MSDELKTILIRCPRCEYEYDCIAPSPPWTTEPSTEEGWYWVHVAAESFACVNKDAPHQLMVYVYKKWQETMIDFLKIDHVHGIRNRYAHTLGEFLNTNKVKGWLKIAVPAPPEEREGTP